MAVEWGWRHMCPWEKNGHPSCGHAHKRQCWGGLVFSRKTARPVLKTSRAGKLGRMRDGSLKQEMHVSRWGLPWAQGCLCPRESKQSMQVKITPLSYSVYFSQNHQNNPNNSSFLIVFLTHPTQRAMLLFAQIKVRGRGRKQLFQKTAGSWDASPQPGTGRGQGQQRLPTTVLHQESRDTLSWAVLFLKSSHQPNQSKPAPCSTQL